MNIFSDTRDLERRITALEDELRAARVTIERLHNVLAEQSSVDARLAELERSRHGSDERLQNLEQGARDMETDSVKFRTALARLEHQRAIDAEEARKVGLGLLERIELRREAGMPTG